MVTKISVIIPVYNAEKTLNKCINSILSQKYDRYEIILVDDDSEDNSYNIMKEYAEKYPDKIKVFKMNKNGGPSRARNLALKNIDGDWISFIDSDDYIDVDFFKELVDKQEKSNADIVIASTVQANEDGKIVRKLKAKSKYYANSAREALDIAYGGEQDLDFVYNLCCNKLYRANLFDGVQFPDGRLQEDAYIMPYILLKINKVVCAEKAIYYYINHVSGISHVAQNGYEDLKRRIDLVNMYIKHVELYRREKLDLYKRSAQNLMNNVISIYQLHYRELKNGEKESFRQLHSIFKKYLWIILINLDIPIQNKVFIFYICFISSFTFKTI